jgi:hypothetical protein
MIRPVLLGWQLRTPRGSMRFPPHTRHEIPTRFVLSVMCAVLLSAPLFAHTDVTSQEQFNRVLPGGLPKQLHYNADRASLELRADEQNCPSSARGFFELNINSQGDVTQARDVSRSRSVHPNRMAVKWVKSILMQIHFRPLRLGSKTTSVHTFATVVCQ